MIKKVSSLLVVLTLLTIAASSLSAQITGGSVTGTVLDINRAVVPNATATLRNNQTGVTLKAQTTSAGSFTFPNVAPGSYTVTIEAPGFQTIEQQVTVVLNQESAVNAVLAVGGVGTNVVDVTAASEALVQTESSTLGRSFQTELVENLPIFGNQNSLALLSPNVVVQAAGTAGSGGVVGGVRPRYNIFTIDGVENNDPSVTGPATDVIQDAVGEFTLLQNNFSAEFGQGGGGQYVTVTKSGTNEFHGSAFVYLQNQHLNAASTREEANLKAGVIKEKPRYRNTRFGATIGGPIVRNKLFFFLAGQHTIESQDATGTSYLAPTGAGLSQIAALPGVSSFVINLLRNNLVLPTTETTTRTVLGTPIPFGTVSLVVPGGSLDKQFQTNVDWNPTNEDQFRFRFSFDNYSAVQAGSGNPKFNNDVLYQTRLFSATYVKAFSSSLVNELRLSYKRAVSDFPLSSDEFLTFPNITVSPLNLAIGPRSNLPQSGQDNTYQVFDTINYITGQHSFKFGAEYRNIITSSNFLPRSRGDYIYATLDELVTDRAPSLSGLRGVGSGAFVASHQQYYFFGQDDWKITRNLTLNLGARYEYVTLPRDAALQELNRIADAPGLIQFTVPKTDNNNIAPRLGFAYSPDFGEGIGRLIFGENRASSIRGNFAMSYAQVFQNLNLLSLPPQFQQSLGVTPQQIATATNFLQSGGLPATPNPPQTTAAARGATGGYITDQRFGELYSFALSFQRELTNNMAMEVRYLGTRGRHLPVQVRFAQPRVNDNALRIPTFLSEPTAAQLQGLPTLSTLRALPGVGTSAFMQQGFLFFLTGFEPVGNSNYDSGSISVTRRFIDGLAFTAAYTYSRAFSDSDNELFTSFINPRRPQDVFNLRDEWSVSTFDIPHRFVIAANWEPGWFNKSSNVFLKNVLGNWVFAPIFQAQSGQPFTPQSGVDSNFNLDSAGDRTILNPSGTTGTGTAVRALALVNGVVTTVALGNAATVAYVAVNPNAQYIQAGPGARATAGRNTLRTNGFHRTDLTALKQLKFGEERYTLQAGVEVFNLFNQRIRTAAGLGVGSTNAFSNVNSAFFNDYSIGNFSGRTIQFRSKFIF